MAGTGLVIDKMKAHRWMRWTLAELDILGEWWYDAPPEKLMKLLPGRTWDAIRGCALSQGMHRKHVIRNSKAIAAERNNRTHQPFAGCRHSAQAKLRIRVCNLHARNHSVADIAERAGIAEASVRSIIARRGEK